VLRGDFGVSMRTGQPVGAAMFEALGRSLAAGAAGDLASCSCWRCRWAWHCGGAARQG
jgi:hypothetical protein